MIRVWFWDWETNANRFPRGEVAAAWVRNQRFSDLPIDRYITTGRVNRNGNSWTLDRTFRHSLSGDILSCCAIAFAGTD